MARVKFKGGRQREFLDCIGNYFCYDWSKIAKICNICDRTLRDWRREKYNMSYEALLKLHKISNIFIPKMVEILPEYWSAKKFAYKGALRRYQIYGNPGTPEGRRKGGINSQRLFRLNPEYATRLGVKTRKTVNKPRPSIELAEFIGIMLGDGGITDYQVKITSNAETDSAYLFYVRKLIKKLFLISTFVTFRPTENANTVVASGKNLVEFLEKKGLKRGNKIRNGIDIPKWILNNRNYSIACLRGLIDADGSFYLYKHRVFNRVYHNFAMCFTNHSLLLLESVYKILKTLGFKPITNNRNRVYLHRQKDIDKYFINVDTHNPKHLQKYKNYSAIRNC